MTISRLRQAGAEFNNVLTEFTSRSNTTVVASATQARTGTYSFRFLTDETASMVLDTTYTQLRCGFFAHQTGVGSGDDPSLLAFRGGGNTGIDLRWNGGASTLNVYVGTTLMESVLSAAFAEQGAWHHVGIDIKLDNSAGWIYVYVDGVEVISFDGDTIGTVATIDTVRFGSGRANQTWNNYLYLDDIYIDNTAGESAPAPVPDQRFERISASGNGASSQWSGSDGNSTDNYLLVDEVTPDDDTTYVESLTVGHIDSYTMGDIALETGWEIAAVIPWAVAKKMSASSPLTLKNYTRTTISGTPYTAASAAQTLGTSYALFWDRRTTDPNGGAWSETDVNNTEIGIEVA